MNQTKRWRRSTSLCTPISIMFMGLMACGSAAVAADAYPTKPIRVVVPFAAGGAADAVARLIAQPLAERLGQSVVVENKAGASGVVGTQFTARAAPDGYTLMIGTQSTHGVNKLFLKDIGYDPIKDFDAVTMISSYGNVLVVPANSPFKSLDQLIEHARAHPGQLTFGTSGAGSSQYLAGVLFEIKTQTKLVNIPYKGGAGAVTDLIGGQIDMAFETISAARSLIDGNRLRALGVTSTLPSPSLPGVVPISAQGVKDFNMASYLGVFAPAGTPRAVLEKLNTEIGLILKRDEVKKSLADIGMEAGDIGLDDFRARQIGDLKKWEAVVAEAGIKAE